MYDKTIKGPIADKFIPWHYPPPSLWKEAKEIDLDWPQFKDIALYIHIPFCEERCSYCNFKAYAKQSRNQINSYFSNLNKEINLYAQKEIIKNSQVKSIYFGGGTPSYVEGELLFDLLDRLKAVFNFSKDFEFSLEANPCTLSAEKLKSLKELGVNRLSIGIQSFSDKVLKAMNRKHNAKQAIVAVKKAKEIGFKNMNIDLIYGYPGETIEIWDKSVSTAIKLDPGRVTCTALTVWPKTVLYIQIKKGNASKIRESFDAKLFNLAFNKILAAGYKPFSALSFSKNGQNVWQQQQDVLSGKIPIIGLGLSALSYNKSFGYLNARSLEDYQKMVEAGNLPIVRAKKIGVKLSRRLRLIQSIKILKLNKKNYEDEIGLSTATLYGRKLKNHLNKGLLTEDGENYKLTKKGILYMGHISRSFYLPLDRFKINQFFSRHYFPLVEQK